VCLPVSGNWVVEWLNLAPVNCVVEWQTEQSCGNPAATWLGFVVFWNASRWQPAHTSGVPAYLPPVWHPLQATRTCAPVSANRVAEWLNDDGSQAAVVWHVRQVCGNPAAT
jgi:hypothetical protein